MKRRVCAVTLNEFYSCVCRTFGLFDHRLALNKRKICLLCVFRPKRGLIFCLFPLGGFQNIFHCCRQLQKAVGGCSTVISRKEIKEMTLMRRFPVACSCLQSKIETDIVIIRTDPMTNQRPASMLA